MFPHLSKRIIAAVGAMLTAVLALGAIAGCGSSDSSAPAPTPSRSVALMPGTHITTSPSGVITYADWQFPDTLNPLQTTEAVSQQTINAIMGSLLVFDQKGELAPYLLREVPSATNGGISADGKVITLKLRPGMRWSDGQEITNKDIKFGWQMYMDPLTGPACAGSCDHIAGITLRGTYEADLHMKDAYAAVLANGLPPVFPHHWARLGATPHQAARTLAQDSSFNYANATYVTSGPYRVTEFVPNNRIVLRANPQYRGPGAPFADKLIFDFYSTKTGMLAAAKKGEIDVTTDYTLADLKQLEQGNGRYAVHKIPGFTIEHLEFNLDKTINGKPNPLHDVRVRQALALAVDKVEMMRVAFGISEAEARQVVAYSPLIVTPGFVQPFGDRSITGQWDPIAKKYVGPGPQAIAHARQLLAQAGYATGFDLRFATTSGNTVRAAQATAILKMWSEIGVRGALDTIPASHFFGQWGTTGPLARGDFQVAMFAFLGGSDPDGLKTNMVSTYIDRQARNHSSVNGNYAGIQDPAIDEAFRTGAGSFDPKVRQAAYSRMQEVMNQKAYWVPLFSRPSIDTASTRLEGFASNPTLLGPTWNVFAWRVAGTPAT